MNRALVAGQLTTPLNIRTVVTFSATVDGAPIAGSYTSSGTAAGLRAHSNLRVEPKNKGYPVSKGSPRKVRKTFRSDLILTLVARNEHSTLMVKSSEISGRSRG
jgi:hypothetical protein